MSNKQATCNDKNHGSLFRLTTIYFFMLKNKSTTKIQTLLTDSVFYPFLNKKCSLVVKNKYTKSNSIEYSRAFFEMLKSSKVNCCNP